MIPEAPLIRLSDISAAEWVRAFDAAWLNGAWDYLERCLALDVQFRSRDSRTTLVGRKAVLGSLRDLAATSDIHEYNATDLTGRNIGSVGVIRYRWQCDWTSAGERWNSNGRDVLILRAIGETWQLRARIRRSLDTDR
jgi:Domain of unknown function (DUF4440)